MKTATRGLAPPILLLVLSAATLGCSQVANSADPAALTPAAKDIFFFIPHTHWEGAVFKTRDEYLDMGLPNILRALRLLKAHPNYRFVLDQACYVKPFLERYRVLFPTSIRDGLCVHEIPFGAIERPAGIECPAQNWIDYGNSRRGVALLNRGLPGNNVAEGTMMLSLLRSTRIQAYGFGGGYELGMSSDFGFELGKEFVFDYALVPLAGDWRQAGVYRDGLEFNHPLLARTVASHPGKLPKRWGLLEITPQNVIVSALKPGPDGAAVLRVYEAAGIPTAAKIRLSAQVVAAEEVNLMEDPGHKLAVVDNTVKLDLRPFEIKSIKLRVC